MKEAWRQVDGSCRPEVHRRATVISDSGKEAARFVIKGRNVKKTPTVSFLFLFLCWSCKGGQQVASMTSSLTDYDGK